VEDYLEKFEELKALLLQNMPLPDEYFVSSFIGGLKPHLKPFVKALNPKTLEDAIRFARFHEDTGDSMRHNQRSFPAKPPQLALPRASSGSGSHGIQPSYPTAPKQVGSNMSSTHFTSARSTGHSFQPTRLISAAERTDKIAKGLCYYYDNPYERGHKCPTKRSQLFLVEVPAGIAEEENLKDEEMTPTASNQTLGFEMLETEPCISFQALNEIQGFQTMRVTGYVGKKAIQILIDSGSTHNFVDQNLANRLGCRLKPIHSQPIAVADGSELKCKYICHNCTWKLQGTEFSSDLLLIPLGSCDMVLGVQWLSQLGTIH